MIQIIKFEINVTVTLWFNVFPDENRDSLAPVTLISKIDN